jgi:ribosome-binding ATPase YchF (GTP1/OBG family)
MELIALEKVEFEEIKKNIKEIRDFLENQGMKSLQKKWYNTIGTAEYLNCAVRTVYHYCNKGLLNPQKVGGILLFDREEIEALINKG